MNIERELRYYIDRRLFLRWSMAAAGSVLIAADNAFSFALPDTIARRRTLWSMGGWNVLEARGESAECADVALAAMAEAVRAVDHTFSVFDAQSTLAAINASRATSIAVDDPLLATGLGTCLGWSSRCDGAFDPTVEDLMRDYGFRQSDDAIIDSRVLKPLRPRSWDHRCVMYDSNRHRLWRESAQIALDSGGWAKGLAAQRAVEAALRVGATAATANCGCDIFRDGIGEDRWTCFIRDPHGRPTDVALRVNHRFKSVATSGNYESFRTTIDGRRIGHLMDPRTGKPADSGLLSVTVFGDDGLAVDAVASALFVMGKHDALRWLERDGDFAAVILEPEWKIDADRLTVVGDLRVGRV